MTSAANGAAPVGVLALQGSFALHERALERCGVSVRLVRLPGDLDGLAGLVVPGGESTVMALLAERYRLVEPLCALARQGLPMFGTCAGAILLGQGAERPQRWGLVDVGIERNAYGTQLDSFSEDLALVPFEHKFHCVFIRAPKLHVRPGDPSIEVLGRSGDDPVLLRSGQFLLASFHPELTDDQRVHRLFLDICASRSARQSSGK